MMIHSYSGSIGNPKGPKDPVINSYIHLNKEFIYPFIY